MALLALPSVCYNLDLSSTGAGAASAQNVPRSYGTNVYRDFLRVLQLRYEGTDRALDNMAKLMTDMNLEDATSPSATRYGPEYSPTEPEELFRPPERPAPPKNGSGIDIIISDPPKYIQMSYTLDFFLCHGRFPTKQDIPPHFSSPGGAERRTAPGLPYDWTSGRTNTQHSQVAASGLPARAATKNIAWTGSPPGSSDRSTSDEARTGSTDISVTHTDDAFFQGSTDPNDFSFEDFMTDGPFTGIGQLQNILHRYPDWP